MNRRLLRLILVVSLLLSAYGPGLTTVASAQAGPVPTIDYGDAPDSSNVAALTMDAYPGVSASFPTTIKAGMGVAGPAHTNSRLRYVLGYGVSGEEDPESGVDQDGTNNIDPKSNTADQDARDDGVALPSELPHCRPVALQLSVTAFDIGQSFPDQAYVNVWMDFDRSGGWGETFSCGEEGQASEWAVQNHMLALPLAGTHVFSLPTFLAWNENPGDNLWLRVTLGEKKAPAADGRGAAGGYDFGETEDHWLESVGSVEPVSALPSHATEIVSPSVLQKLFVGPISSGPGTPGGVALTPGDLYEVDVAHLGGTGSPTPPLVVTAVGSGAGGRLLSWQMGSQGDEPVYLGETGLIPGTDHQLQVLAPPNNPKNGLQMLVGARIWHGNLWLTTWRAQNDGSLVELDTLGYGSNADVEVEHYAMAYRVLAYSPNDKRFQFTTPLLHNSRKYLRLVTWQIDGTTGKITGKHDSGNLAIDASSTSDLGVVYAAGDAAAVAPHYAVSFSNKSNLLETYSFDVTAAGLPTLRGQASSGRDIRNNVNVGVSATKLATAPLGNIGFVSATDASNGNLRMFTWEQLVSNCPGNDPCPYQLSAVSDNTQDGDPIAPGVQISPPAIVTLRGLVRDPLYQLDWFAQNAVGLQAIASVRKVMVTIVALDAVEAGEASLDDVVTVSAAAANVNNSGASSMGLVAGEKITLRNLLYGNIMRSAGDATWAISEHVGGTLDGMNSRMNAKATELGMDNTVHCSEGTVFSSVAYSTARDQATLWASVYDNPLFLEFAGASSQEVCGVVNNFAFCHPATQPMTRGTNQWPSLDGQKTGGGGGTCPTKQPTLANVPTCIGGGCLSVQATRLDRPLIISLLQPSNLVGNRWSDAGALFDYAYRRIFTPDRRAANSVDGVTAHDFGLDYISDKWTVTASLEGDKGLRLCNWATDVGTGSLTRTKCTLRQVKTLPPGSNNTQPTVLDMARISTLEADGDYVLGRRQGDLLVMRLWRVGSRQP